MVSGKHNKGVIIENAEHRRVIGRGIFGVSYELISFRALIYLKKAVTLQKEVLDTPEELIITHQAIANVLRGLKREEDAENEMELVAEYVKMLAPLELALAVNETRKDELVTASVSRPAEQVVSKNSTVCIAS